MASRFASSSFTSSLVAAALLATLVAAFPARAATVSTTANTVGATLFQYTQSGSFSYNADVSATFAGFDPSLGTLNSVSFDYQYDYTFDVTFVGPGGGGGGANSGLGINGNVFNTRSFAELNSSTTYSYSGSVGDIQLPLSTFGSTYTFDLLSSGGFASGGAPGYTVDALFSVAPSTVTVTYDYTPAVPTSAVPEPSTVALVGIAVLTLLPALRRRRKGALPSMR